MLTFCLFIVYLIKYSCQKIRDMYIKGWKAILPTPSIADDSSNINTMQLNINAWNPRILTPRLFFFILLSLVSFIVYRLIIYAPISIVMIFLTFLNPLCLTFIAPLINFVNNPALRRFSVTHLKEIFGKIN